MKTSALIFKYSVFENFAFLFLEKDREKEWARQNKCAHSLNAFKSGCEQGQDNQKREDSNLIQPEG